MRAGTEIVVVTQQLEFNGPVGRMLAAVMLGLAEIEMEYRRERQAAGIAVAKKQGIYTGRQNGTTKSKPNRAIRLKNKGLTTAEISEGSGTKSISDGPFRPCSPTWRR